MGVIAQYSYASFQAMLPALASVQTTTVQKYWNDAAFFHDNTGAGPVDSTPLQAAAMNYMAAHLMVMGGAVVVNSDGSITAPPVGNINSATEGSVSVGVQNDYPPGSAQWYQQTTFGSAYYLMMAPTRTVRYRVAPRRLFNPPFLGPWGR